jgi:hypothetical protein
MYAWGDSGVTTMSVIGDRLKRLRHLGRELPVKYELEKALEAIDISLENVHDLHEMAKTNGWQLLRDRMESDIRNKIQAEHGLACDPEKNRNALIINHCVVETMKRILSVVDSTLKHEPSLVTEKNKLIGRKRS